MPYVNIVTSKALDPQEVQTLHASVLSAAALLGKPAASVMVHVQDRAVLQRGQESGHCAYCDVQVLGQPQQEAADAFAQALCADIARIAQTQPGSLYLTLRTMELCYTDGALLRARKP